MRWFCCTRSSSGLNANRPSLFSWRSVILRRKKFSWRLTRSTLAAIRRARTMSLKWSYLPLLCNRNRSGIKLASIWCSYLLRKIKTNLIGRGCQKKLSNRSTYNVIGQSGSTKTMKKAKDTKACKALTRMTCKTSTIQMMKKKFP